MKHRRLTWLASLVAIFALVCGLGLGGCSAANKQQAADKADASQEVSTDETGVAETSGDEASASEADGDEAATYEETADKSKTDGAPLKSKVTTDESDVSDAITEDGEYSSKDEVAWYLHTYGHLPSNYVTKEEAEDAGWKTQGLTLWEACPGKSIGGGRFGNREGRLPKAKGRTWYECDIDYAGERSRNAKRIVYSNDGLIYYTDDHYNTFEQLY